MSIRVFLSLSRALRTRHQSNLVTVWTTRPDKEVAINISSSGPASIPPITVIEAFTSTVQSFSHYPALKAKRNNIWVTWTYQQYYEDVIKVAKSMIKLGLEPHHGVGILGYNSPEWFISYMGAIMSGGIAAGVYTTNTDESCRYIAEHCRTQVFFCDSETQVDKILKHKDTLKHLKAIVQFLEKPHLNSAMKAQGVVSWKDFLTIGKNISDEELDKRIINQKPGHCASLVYTSGTTGPPKGVMLSHDNLIWSAKVSTQYYNLDENTRIVSFLPLSHIAAQMIDIMAAVVVGHCVWFAQPDALKGSIKETLLEVKPTLFFCVPQVWEKMKIAIEAKLQSFNLLKRFIVKTCMGIGKKTVSARQINGALSRGHWIANKLVFQSLRKDIGLQDCNIAATGAAPISADVVEFLSGFDIPVYQLYGMSETTGVGCLNGIGNFRQMSVGHQLNGVEVKLCNTANSDSKEICFRGRNIFMGYLHDEGKTMEIMDKNGWLHTGDLGYADNDGFYYITGRSKELIITEGGENIAPLLIEKNILNYAKLLSNLVVIGDNKKYLTTLLTLRCQMDENGNPTNNLDPAVIPLLMNEIGSNATKVSDALKDPLVLRYIESCVEKANAKAISRAAQVKKFYILPCDFSINGGELTPTLKVKREAVASKYKNIIDKLYENE